MTYEKPQYTEYGLTQWNWLVRHREKFVLGEGTQIGAFTVIDAMNSITIEDNVKVGFSCVILSNSTIDNKAGPVVLKKNCKIGANSTIMPGITIGENAVIGANSFVNKDVPANELWFGVPARFQKKL